MDGRDMSLAILGEYVYGCGSFGADLVSTSVESKYVSSVKLYIYAYIYIL